MPSYDFRSPRIFLEEPLGKGRTIAATPAQTNYLLNVLRMGDGETILAFNGSHGEWRCTLQRPSKKKLEFVAVEETREQTPPYDLVYAFAPLKIGRIDYMVQKAVEMGAGVLQPVLTHHTQSHRVKLDKMRANAIEAAEQCGILTIPECREPIKFDAFLSTWKKDIPLIFCDERTDQGSPIEDLATLDTGPKGLLVGPEGGFSSAERDTLRNASFTTTISLGPRILRADTAAVASLALVQAVCGDWRTRR